MLDRALDSYGDGKYIRRTSKVMAHDALNKYAIIFEYLQNSATTTLVLAGSYDDFIAFSNLIHNSYRGYQAPKEPQVPAK